MTLPLEDIKVLDLSRLLAGPFCTMILGDMGADVLRIEEPNARLGTRRDVFTPYGMPSEEEERISAYNCISRNKRSLALNLKRKEGRQIFYKLAETADVVYENFRPAVKKRLGVDYETISSINPRIIYCSLSGFGQEGPYRDLPGHDITFISMSGVLSIAGGPDGRPVHPGVPIGDVGGGGMLAAIGILVALMARQKTGKGQYIDISITEGVINFLAPESVNYFAKGEVPRRGQRQVDGCDTFETKDGKYITIIGTGGEPWFWQNLCRALGREDLATTFIPSYKRTEAPKREEAFSYLRQVFRTKTRDQWFKFLRRVDTCVSPVYTLDEVFSDPQMVHRQVAVEVEHPKFGKVKQLGIPIKLSETPGAIRRFAPLLGEHTEDVLLSLGYSKERIERLRRTGVVK